MRVGIGVFDNVVVVKGVCLGAKRRAAKGEMREI